jgi:predicted phage terminase large subunit-like protein
VIRRTLDAKVVINEHGRRREVTKLEAGMIQLTNKAAAGDMRALYMLTALARMAEESDTQEVSDKTDFAEADQKVLQSLMERFTVRMQRLAGLADDGAGFSEPANDVCFIFLAMAGNRSIFQVLSEILGEYNFAGQYQQAPAPLEGGMVQRSWFNTYAPHELPATFDYMFQSWDTANKSGEIHDYNVCTTWGVAAKQHLYLLDVFRARLEYPELKRKIVRHAQLHQAKSVVIEDNASGTQLLQDLKHDGLSIVTGYKSTGDKVMRMFAVTSTIENGFVHIPDKAVEHEALICPKCNSSAVASYGNGGGFHRCGCGHSWESPALPTHRISNSPVPLLRRDGLTDCPECGGVSVMDLGRGIQRCANGTPGQRARGVNCRQGAVFERKFERLSRKTPHLAI